MREGVYKNRLKKTCEEIKNEAAAERFAALQKMLGNLPPTPYELSLIKLNGPWPGFGYPIKDKNNRYSQTVFKNSKRTSPK
tara:strand:+ start:1232 stop:1474 length:243 start_codon:yes stop_codon:yes gene_type:complete